MITLRIIAAVMMSSRRIALKLQLTVRYNNKPFAVLPRWMRNVQVDSSIVREFFPPSSVRAGSLVRITDESLSITEIKGWPSRSMKYPRLSIVAEKKVKGTIRARGSPSSNTIRQLFRSIRLSVSGDCLWVLVKAGDEVSRSGGRLAIAINPLLQMLIVNRTLCAGRQKY